MIRDIAGNIIEPGDIILRACRSTLQKRKVVHVTNCTIQVERDRRYDYFYEESRPLSIYAYNSLKNNNIINLSKTTTDEMHNH